MGGNLIMEITLSKDARSLIEALISSLQKISEGVTTHHAARIPKVASEKRLGNSGRQPAFKKLDPMNIEHAMYAWKILHRRERERKLSDGEMAIWGSFRSRVKSLEHATKDDFKTLIDIYNQVRAAIDARGSE